jgi:hypothetical protein
LISIMGNLVLFGFMATLGMTAIMLASQGLGLSRLSLPFLMGTFVTANRDTATSIGFFLYVVGGWVFAALYFWLFSSLNIYAWWFGALVGLCHGAFLLLSITLLPSVHPRMASEYHGVTERRQLEPPGFMAINYGYQTPTAILAAQTVYGMILGACVHIQHMMAV